MGGCSTSLLVAALSDPGTTNRVEQNQRRMGIRSWDGAAEVEDG
jgi:hypothetical protein